MSPASPHHLAGVGIDVVQIDRFVRSIGRTPSLIERVFTSGEQRDCAHVDGSWQVWKLAARFAAKEAVAKAFGTGIDGFAFTDIEIVNNADGRPEVRLGAAAAHVAKQRGIGELFVSLSHTREIAVAQVVAEAAR